MSSLDDVICEDDVRPFVTRDDAEMYAWFTEQMMSRLDGHIGCLGAGFRGVSGSPEVTA